MRPFLLLAFLALLPLSAPALPEKDAFLAAIRMVETGDRPGAVGSLGERGSYQFRSHVWRQHSRLPFRLAHDPSAADRVAAAHFDWLVDACRSAGVAPTAQTLAVAWNAGLSRAIGGRAPRVSIDYASRVARLMGVRVARVASSTPLRLPPILADHGVHFRSASALR
jgi:hypothetical protein